MKAASDTSTGDVVQNMYVIAKRPRSKAFTYVAVEINCHAHCLPPKKLCPAIQPRTIHRSRSKTVYHLRGTGARWPAGGSIPFLQRIASQASPVRQRASICKSGYCHQVDAGPAVRVLLRRRRTA